MISIDESRRLLGQLATGKSDEQVRAMRDSLYQIARMIVSSYSRRASSADDRGAVQIPTRCEPQAGARTRSRARKRRAKEQAK